MKIDPNQLVGGAIEITDGYMEPYGEKGAHSSHVTTHAGAVPLRWDAMVRLAAGAMAAGDISDKAEDIDRQCEWIAQVVDRLIAAHNETCGEGNDE